MIWRLWLASVTIDIVAINHGQRTESRSSCRYCRLSGVSASWFGETRTARRERMESLSKDRRVSERAATPDLDRCKPHRALPASVNRVRDATLRQAFPRRWL
ncbi:hypothetical protein B0H11DRAFT_1950530 [Mycena galericulata]|nr:hypothetical protein B0H11DRAFT_1950530 [Mycena galericulata]